jgi:hypothetical protein
MHRCEFGIYTDNIRYVLFKKEERFIRSQFNMVWYGEYSINTVHVCSIGIHDLGYGGLILSDGGNGTSMDV